MKFRNGRALAVFMAFWTSRTPFGCPRCVRPLFTGTSGGWDAIAGRASARLAGIGSVLRPSSLPRDWSLLVLSGSA